MQNIEATLYFEEIAMAGYKKWRENVSIVIVVFPLRWAASANAGLPRKQKFHTVPPTRVGNTQSSALFVRGKRGPCSGRTACVITVAPVHCKYT